MRYPSRLIFLAVFLIAGCGHSEDNSLDGAPSVAAAELQAAAKDPGVRSFYKADGWRAVWSKDDEKKLAKALANRAEHGLDRVVFLADAGGRSPAEREAALTRAALGYASALAKGVADPNKLYKIYAAPRPDPDLGAGLLGALQKGNLAEWFAGLAPQDAEYRTLSGLYQALLHPAAKKPKGDEGIPDTGKPIRPGGRDKRVPQIAAALNALGYLAEAGDEKSKRLSPAVAQAVRRFQQDNDEPANAVVTRGTIAALNEALADRGRLIAVALERRRWLRRDVPATRIDVNIPLAGLTYVRDGQVVDRRRVIVGQPGWETPQLQASFFQLVANPTWTVPKSIEAKEMGNVSADYLARHNMVRREGQIVQLSGPTNSLGLVKFDLDDKYAIYLHDTPEKSWFSTDTRARSHGCVRVQDALGFAQMIAADQQITGDWQEARAAGDESFLKLPHPITVRLLYHPIWADETGRVYFGRDIYGWDEPIAEQLGFGTGRARRLAPPVTDIGP